MIQIVGLFLLAIAVMAVVSRFRMPGDKTPRIARKCRACGRPLIGKGPCDCKGTRGA